MRSKSLKSICLAAVLAAASALAACAFPGAATVGDNPVLRKFTWFSYLGGDDIRAACVSGMPPRYRLVYNAIYTEQVRAYDIEEAGDGRFDLRVQATRPVNLRHLRLDSPGDLLNPWRPVSAERALDAADVARFEAALDKSGVFDDTPRRVDLPSISFYWVIAGCRDGTFRLDAVRWPSARFAAVSFDDVLFAWDETKVPVNQPRVATAFDVYGTNDQREYRDNFNLTLSEGRLR